MPSQKQLKSVMFAAAEVACKILLRYCGKLERYDEKSEADIVTIADREAEKAIFRKIRATFPDHGLLGEESGGDDFRDAEYCWIVDPVDGTTNFAHAAPNFAVSIGLVHHGERLMGLIVDPSRDEWFFARRGGGAFLNGKRIRVSGVRSLSRSLLVTGFPHGSRRNIGHYIRILEHIQVRSHGVLRLGSAAICLAWVACGRLEAYWEENVHAWDVAAGLLLVEEAGGKCTRFDRKRMTLDGLQFLTTNGLVHAATRREVLKTWEPE
jgi:myo-inositol-1(or 4)-monophosphatase